VTVAAALTLALLGSWYVDHRLVDQLGRVPGAFDHLSDRPTDTDSTTMLLVLEDRDRTEPAGASWLPRAGTVRTVLLVSVDPGGERAHVLALPLGATAPDGRTIGEATSAPSASRLVHAVEEGTREHVDHLAVLDLAYIRARAEAEHGLELPDGWVSPDEVVDRFTTPAQGPPEVRRQLEVLDHLMEGTVHQSFRRHPRQLWSALDLVTRHTAVEAGWSAPEMGWTVLSLRDLRSADIDYRLAPMSCVDGDRCALRAVTQ
jgi:hypothetical protein